MTRNAVFARLIFAMMALATLVHAAWMIQGLRDAREVVAAREGMRRLAALTIHNFPDRNLPSPSAFWKSIGRDAPIRDAWGNDYLIESTGTGEKARVFWRCAGPDRRWGTHDDIEVEVPYSNSPVSDFSPADFRPPVPPAADAK